MSVKPQPNSTAIAYRFRALGRGNRVTRSKKRSLLDRSPPKESIMSR
ncbi:MAG: hypothetical protein ACRC11_03425 [Xenococcaceae cyanobacterium]